jgi:NADH-quinone oxidoreductase subunit L
MAHDGGYYRFFGYLNLFVFFMLTLVLANNYVLLFVGWEGVGLCSYLLIGFYFHKKSASNAANKAFLVNRIGDASFVLGMLLLFSAVGTLKFSEIPAALAAGHFEVETAAFGAISLITMFLFIGATGKSAQIPLYVWRPDALEGPTPVSAQLHAATMVTAGVYLIGRNAVLFGHAEITLQVIAVIGCLTALMAGTIGLVQNDIKRVLAYSTVSQLGYMFLAMGVGAYAAGIFHLYTHAFFKALLFLGSGAVIHALHGEQDMRYMGGLRRHLPITFWTFVIGTLAIAGFPGLSGFFSKDEILWKTYSSGHTVLWFLAVVTAFLTATYMFRLLYLTFFGERRPGSSLGDGDGHGGGHDDDAHGHGAHGGHLHDAPPAMAIALVVLAIGAVAAGYVGVPHALGGDNRIEAFLEPSFHAAGVTEPAAEPAHADPATELGLMGVSILVAFAGIGLATLMFLRRPELADTMAKRLGGVHRLLLNKYYVDEVYDATLVQPIKRTSTGLLWRGMDAGFIDGTVNAVGLVVRGWSAVLRRLQTGSVRAYAMSLFLGVVVVVGYYLWR